MAPPCIVNVMLGRGLGGLEQVMLDYQEALSRHGHAVHAVVHPDAAIRPALQARGASCHPLPQHGAWDVLAAMRLRRLLQLLRPDASIAHGNRAMALLRRTGARQLIAVLPNYKMKCEGAAAVFYPTLDLKRHAMALGVPEARLHYVPSMVDVPAVPPSRRWRSPPVIGAMGRFVAKKGFATFLAALARLRAMGLDFHAVLAGDGPERAALEQTASRLGLTDCLTFPGWLHDKPAFFAGIDVFCLPSLHEPFGIVLIEAMAQALPIVAADSEGPGEILRDAADGLIVPRGDADQLAAALGALLADPAQADRLGAGAHRRVRARFSADVVGSMLDAAVRRVADAPMVVEATG